MYANSINLYVYKNIIIIPILQVNNRSTEKVNNFLKVM